MTFDSTIVSTLIAIATGAIGWIFAWLLTSQKLNHDLQIQDVRTAEAIKRLEEKLAELKGDLKETRKEQEICDRELEKAIESGNSRFRSLVNFLAGKGLHYRVRSGDKETLS